MTPETYYRKLLNCALQQARRGETAGTLRDRAIALALDHGAEPADVRAFTSPSTTAALRWMLDAGRVVVAGVLHNPRHGRAEPTYMLVAAEAELPVPRPPRPRPPSTEVAAIRAKAHASQAEHELEFYKSFANDSAHLLVRIEKLLRGLRERNAMAYQDFAQGKPCED